MIWIEEVRSRLAARPATDLPPDVPGRPAAVLVPLFVARGVLHVLLTRRSDEIDVHRGQISFPGGSREPDDRDLAMTALRETHEEVGIDPTRVLVLGRLDERPSVTGFRVTPWVGAIPFPDEWRPEAGEIAEILTYPLARFLEPGVVGVHEVEWEGRPRRVISYDVGPRPVWGLTARILAELIEAIVPGSEEPAMPMTRANEDGGGWTG